MWKQAYLSNTSHNIHIRMNANTITNANASIYTNIDIYISIDTPTKTNTYNSYGC